MNAKSLILILCLCVLLQISRAQEILVVDADKVITPIQPTMWGVFFEDINFGADGGLYAELVKNRSFEFDSPLMGWSEHNSNKFANESNAGQALVLNKAENNSRFIRVSLFKDSGYGLTNEGFRGIGVKQGNTYVFSLNANLIDGSPLIRIQLVDSKGSVIGDSQVKLSGKGWQHYSMEIQSTASDQKAKLTLLFEGKGVVDLDMISLFPKDTWKNRPNGLRKDLVEKLADLKPGFLRFPGGCIVEGRELATRYQWKKTVGNVEDRDVMINRWNTEFKHRPAPDYFQSFGLGFFEYFQLAEDIGATPLPILSCGLACQFNTAEAVPLEDIDPYIQDAIDLIEFANGDVGTKWGQLRASMGHPAPFNLKLIGVGNEQWGPQYIDRYKLFSKAIKEKYPDVKIVSGAGPFPDGELFNYASKELKSLNAEIIDEHYYAKPDWFLKNATRYDSYDRTGPKIFAGEYAAQSVATVSPENKNNWLCALSEAAFMTGLERNADVVYLCSYAPLFAHDEGWQWTPDLIWFNNLESYATPNYYVQQMFSVNKGTHLLNVSANNVPLTGQNGIYASSVWDNKSKEIIVKIVNASESKKLQRLKIESKKALLSDVDVVLLTSANQDAVNSFESKEAVHPVALKSKIKNKQLSMELAPWSFTVIKIKTK